VGCNGMDGDDALGGEMRRLPGPRPADPPLLDPDTVERMLAGAVHPSDAPPGYEDVVRVLAATAAPPSAVELAGEADAVAAFRAARRPLTPSRRKPVLGKLASGKVLVAIAAGAVSIGTAAAAATGSLPAPAQHAADRVLHHADASNSIAPAAPLKSDGSLPGAAGLCHAWGQGQGGDHGKKLDATAFGRLADAAGGAGKVAAYCAALDKSSAKADASGKPSSSHAPAKPDAIAGACHAWLAAESHGQVDKALRDRLATAAGGVQKITTYCTTLVSASPAASHPTPPQPSDHGHVGGPTPPPTSHP
jgi:hypothetical protein